MGNKAKGRKYCIKLGVVCFARDTFDSGAADALYRKILTDIYQLENIEFVVAEELIKESPDALRAGRMFAEKRVDGIIVISGTFHLGHLILDIKKLCDKPLLLWALPELPYNGGKIRLNSICGVNLDASNLVKSGINDFVYSVGKDIDENFIDAIRMSAALRDARIGIIGSRAHGFFNVGTDELSLYGKFGALVDRFELSDLWREKESEKDTLEYKEKININFDVSALSPEQINKTAALAAKFKSFVNSRGLSAIAVRCWPEFAEGYGTAPCAAMSLLQSEDFILACEGDIDCALTMLCHKAAGAVTPFMADLSQVNTEENSALLWHCGVAPCNLADGISCCTLDSYHAGGKGVTAGFVLKSGEINIARLDSIGGKYRLLQEKGTAYPMDKLLTGTYAKVSFGIHIKELLDKIVYSGAAHHVSMVYGDYSEAFKIFARLQGLEIL